VRLHAADPPGFGVILMDLYRDRILGEDSLVRVAKGRASKGE
jgi:hypothetical protein